MQVGNTMADYFLIFYKQHHQMSCEYKADDKDCDTVNGLQHQSAPEAFPHPVLFAGAFILCHQRGHGVGDILLRCVGEIIDPVDNSKCSSHRDNCLNPKLSKLDGCLLHGGCPAVSDGLF